MLVLTRKANEQILIGDDIKITLVRVRGNSVRVGIEAPREVRVVRGELADRASDHDRELEYELEERESVFAHPQPKIGRHTKKTADNRLPQPALEQAALEQSTPEQSPLTQAASMDKHPRIYVGRIRPASTEGKSGRAPLAGFVSAT